MILSNISDLSARKLARQLSAREQRPISIYLTPASGLWIIQPKAERAPAGAKFILNVHDNFTQKTNPD